MKTTPKKSKEFLLFAHRGGLLAGPGTENTLEAFRSATNAGIKCLETDVLVTRDHHVIICHGSANRFMEIKSGLPLRKKLQTMTLSEINKKFYHDGRSAVVLSDLLQKIPDAFFSIDVKTNEVVAPAIETILKANASARVSVTSFSLKRTLLARELLRKKSNYDSASICVYETQARLLKTFIHIFFRYLQKRDVKIVHFPYKLIDLRLINAARSSKIKVFAWTVNNEKDMKLLENLGVDGIISDHPDRLRKP